MANAIRDACHLEPRWLAALLRIEKEGGNRQFGVGSTRIHHDSAHRAKRSDQVRLACGIGAVDRSGSQQRRRAHIAQHHGHTHVALSMLPSGPSH